MVLFILLLIGILFISNLKNNKLYILLFISIYLILSQENLGLISVGADVAGYLAEEICATEAGRGSAVCCKGYYVYEYTGSPTQILHLISQGELSDLIDMVTTGNISIPSGIDLTEIQPPPGSWLLYNFDSDFLEDHPYCTEHIELSPPSWHWSTWMDDIQPNAHKYNSSPI